ncbi:MAG: ABC transporter ATP-binding protein [Desulfurococcaceae archaeon]|jgi:branched-chain amino acid transport system ATP-binding protein|nr:ABC transporter ATP-binding protein [Desulfurococcaceae archaeon]
MSVILEVRDVAKYFGGVKALDGVSLTVPERGLIGLIGPNGSGKTTLFNVITGFYVPDRGSVLFRESNDLVRIDGLNPNEVFKKGIVRTFQIPRLFNSLTVLENLLVTPLGQKGENPVRALFRNSWSKQERELASKAIELLKTFNMLHYVNSKISELSAAHIKMLETIRGLMTPAKLYLLDEPAAGVDYAMARELFTYVRKLRDEHNLTFFIIEHRLEILMEYVDYVYVLHNGKLLSEGKPQEVISDPKVIEAYIGV